MGTPYQKAIGQFSCGDYGGATNKEDDFTVSPRPAGCAADPQIPVTPANTTTIIPATHTNRSSTAICPTAPMSTAARRQPRHPSPARSTRTASPPQPLRRASSGEACMAVVAAHQLCACVADAAAVPTACPAPACLLACTTPHPTGAQPAPTTFPSQLRQAPPRCSCWSRPSALSARRVPTSMPASRC